MYTREYDGRERPFRLPPHYGGCAFRNQKEETPTEPTQKILPSLPMPNLADSVQSLLGRAFGTRGGLDFDELLLLGLILLLSGGEKSGDVIPILALLLFCSP